ncbi:MAG: hypothetical protein ACXVI1_12255 [Halobacteriota archaeon]
MKRAKISLSRVNFYFVLGDLRKFAEQCGDLAGWDTSNRAYVITHGASGVERAHYRHPLPESVYSIYVKSSKDATAQMTKTAIQRSALGLN